MSGPQHLSKLQGQERFWIVSYLRSTKLRTDVQNPGDAKAVLLEAPLMISIVHSRHIGYKQQE